MRIRKNLLGLAFAALAFTPLTLAAQHQRNVLLEDFSSVTCVNCPEASAIVNEIVDEQNGRVIAIQYHLDIPGRNDPFYALNKPDNDARANYYGGFNALPQVMVNGIGLGTAATNEATVRSDVNTALAEESPVTIEVTQVRAGSTVNVSVTVTPADDLPGTYRLFAVAVEKHVERPASYFANSQPYYGETVFRDLFRDLISPAAGTEVDFAGGEDQTYTYSYTLGNDWDPSQMAVVAWVQDEFDQTVLQAGESEQLPSSVLEDRAMAGYDLEPIAPNPTGSRFSFAYSVGSSESEITVALYDATGRIVSSAELGAKEAGDHRADMDVSDLPSGVYTLTLTAGEYRASQKVVVAR